MTHRSPPVLLAALLGLLLSAAGPADARRGRAAAKKDDDEQVKKELQDLRDQADAEKRRADALAEELQQLRREVDALKTQGETPTPSPAAPTDAALEDKVVALEDNLQDRLDLVENDINDIVGVQDRLLNIISRNRLNWFGDFRITNNNIYFQSTPPGGGPTKNTWYPLFFTTRFRLGMAWEITDNLRFFGTLVAQRDFNQDQPDPLRPSSEATRWPRDLTLRIERAYFDWFVTEWLVFTAGRLAAPEGPPAELKENTPRTATWGVQLVENSYDMMFVTFRMEQFWPGSFLRLIWLPLSPVTRNNVFDQNSLFEFRGRDSMHALAGSLELRLPFIGDNLVQLSSVVVPEFKTIDVPLAGALPSEPVPDSLGWMFQVSGLFEWKNLFRSGFDVFAAYTYTFLQPNANRVVYDFGDGLQAPVGLASYDDPNQNQGHFAWTGMRYSTPFGRFAPKVGAEVSYGSKYHVAFAAPTDLRINKIAARGLTLEGYWIQPLVPGKLFLRAGVVHLRRMYTGSYIGPATPVDDVINNFNTLIHVSW